MASEYQRDPIDSAEQGKLKADQAQLPFRKELLKIAAEVIPNHDPAHDFSHSLRVLILAERISANEGGDLTVVTPAALFHDLVSYPKNSHRTHLSAEESADAAGSILSNLADYPKNKIPLVHAAIRCHSFGTLLSPDFLEARIIQDADALEATGAIAIMRTFASTGVMKRPFYHIADPFCSDRNPDDRRYALDLFVTRLFKVEEHLHTSTARRLAKRRMNFLHLFISELRHELNM